MQAYKLLLWINEILFFLLLFFSFSIKDPKRSLDIERSLELKQWCSEIMNRLESEPSVTETNVDELRASLLGKVLEYHRKCFEEDTSPHDVSEEETKRTRRTHTNFTVAPRASEEATLADPRGKRSGESSFWNCFACYQKGI